AVPAVRGRPAEAGPARGGQPPVPRQPLRERLVLAPRPARAPQLSGHVRGQPGGDPTAEFLVSRAELHATTLPSTCLVWSSSGADDPDHDPDHDPGSGRER